MAECLVAFLLSVFCAHVYFDGLAIHMAQELPMPPLEVYMSGVIAGLVVLWPLCLFGVAPALMGFSWAGLVGFMGSSAIATMKQQQLSKRSLS